MNMKKIFLGLDVVAISLTNLFVGQGLPTEATDLALENIVAHMKSLGFKGGIVRIAHCFNEKAGLKLKELIQREFSGAEIIINKCRGLCSFYAEKGGILVGFETA